MKTNIFPDNGILNDVDYDYKLLSEHSYGLNIFGLTEKQWIKINGNWKKQLEIVLNYLEPLIKEGKLEVMIEKGFNNKEDLLDFLKCIKTEGVKNKIINSEKNNKFDYEYSKSEIDTFKDDISNIMFQYCKDDNKRMNFEEFNVWFRLPGTVWELRGIYAK